MQSREPLIAIVPVPPADPKEDDDVAAEIWHFPEVGAATDADDDVQPPDVMDAMETRTEKPIRCRNTDHRR